ncbi:MAG: thioredoxin family protein [Planctomycetaceae bacterium]|nr:thioredoxin family protein [Planctomycetaceae bacterium]
MLIFIAIPNLLSAADATWYRDVNQAWRDAERTKRPLLFHFGAKWCAPCQKMEQLTLHQPGVRQALSVSVIGVKVDADENPALLKKFGIERLPTDAVVEPSGQMLLITNGFKTEQEYLQFIMRGRTRYAEVVPRRELASQSPVTGQSSENSSPEALLMLDGYCPVTLSRRREWRRGQTAVSTIYKDQRYAFVSEEAKQEFLNHPERYAPQFLGCDPVVVWNTDRAIPGSVEFGAYYDNLLYLFSTDETRHQFKSNPDKFLTTKVVLSPNEIERVYR